MTIEMRADGTVHGRPAADAFDLPRALAEREQHRMSQRRDEETSTTAGADVTARVMIDEQAAASSRSAAPEDLPRRFEPWSDS